MSEIHLHFRFLIKTSFFALGILITSITYANPVLDNVAAGNATVQQTQNSTVVNQTSQRAVLNWQSFNIGGNESTHFQQPAGGVALNRINGNQGASQIYGSLTATGQIILINPAGIYFGPSAVVNVGGLVATTANITDQNFLNSNYQFNKVDGYSGAIINEGQIIAAQNGLVALVAPGVINKGLIQANLGKIVLASGEAFTMNFSGDNLINFAIDAKTTSAGRDKNGNALRDGVANTGSLIADGGTILVTAKAAQGILDHVINLDGVAQAKSVAQRNGEIILLGDKDAGVVRVAAKINTSGKTSGTKGGNVTITGYNILLDEGTTIDASGDVGGGNILIGGNYQGKGPLPNANAVVMASTAYLNADAISNGNGGNVILWSDNVTKIYGSISARGGALSGDGGFVETSGKNYLDVNGARVDTRAPLGATGMWLLDPTNIWIADNLANAQAAGMVGTDTSANTGSGGNPDIFQASGAVDDSLLTTGSLETALGTSNVTVLTTNASGSGAGNITVVNAIDWATANTLLLQADNNIIINAAITGLSGTLELSAINAANSITTGANGTINVANFTLTQGQWSQLTATLPSFTVSNNFLLSSGTKFLRATSGSGTVGSPYLITDVFGLQGVGTYTTSSFSLANDIDASVTSNWTTSASVKGFIPIGIAVTNNYSGTFDGNNHTINNLYIYQPQSGTNGTGLFGSNAGTIQNLNITNASLTVNQYGGLLTGFNFGTINNVYANGTVTSQPNGATVANYVGGLAARSAGTITNSHTNVTMTLQGQRSGGFIGLNDSGGTISNSYSQGTITGLDGAVGPATYIGGFAGFNLGSITSSYSAAAVSGVNTVGGFVGINSGGTISNSFSLGPVTAAATGSLANFGGFVGSQATGSITNSYSTGYINGGAAGSQYGFGLVSGGTATNNFWDTDTSGKSASGASVGTVTGGCFSGTCSNGGTANLSSSTTYTGAGWDLSTVWNIIDGQSYPYLRGINSTTPRIIRGTSALAAGTGISVASQGAVAGTFYVGANGAYYIFLPNSAIADNGAALLYNNGSTKGNLLIHGPSGSNTLSGLIITNGQLTIGTSATDTFTSADLTGAIGSLANSDILYTASGNNVTLTNNINLVTTATSDFSAGGNITASGTGTLTFAKNLALTADSILTGADVNVSGTVSGANNALTVSNTGTSSTITGIMSNLSSFTKSGAGTLVLSGVNTYTGNTNINGGTLQLDSTGTIANSGVVLANVSGAILDIASHNKTIASLSGGGATGGNVTLGTGTLTFGDSSTTNFAGVISDDGVTGGNIIKQGSGSATLSGANTYLGTTTINAGTLVASNASALGTTAAGTTVNDGASLNINNVNIGNEAITLNGTGSITGTGASAEISANIALGSNSSFGGTGTLTLSGILSGSGLGITKTGSGTLVLGGANTYNGTTTINSGTLQLNGTGSIVSSAVVLANDATAVLDLNGNSKTIASLSGGGTTGGNVTLGAGTLTFGDSNDNTYAGVISGTGGITKQGSGTQTLSGVNTFSGTTTINAGTVQLDSTGTIANSAVALANNATAILNLNGNSKTIASLSGGGTTGGNVTLGAGTLTLGNATNNTFGGVISGTGGITKQGSGTQTLSGVNTYSGTTTINAGTLALDATGTIANSAVSLANSAGATFDLGGNSKTIASLSGGGTTGGNVTLGAGTLTFGNSNSTSFDGVISGTGGITKQGSGSFTATGANTYDGTTTVNAGTFNVANTSGLGSTLGGTTVASGATLNINGVAVGNEAITLNGGTLGNSTGSASLGGNITLGANSIISSASAFTLNGNINGGNGLTLQGSGNLIIAGLIGNSTALSSLTSNVTGLTLNGGAVTTTGNQTYNTSVALGATTTFTSQGDGSSSSSFSINLGNGVTGNQNLNFVAGTIGNFGLTLAGTLALNNVNVTGNAGGSNTLTLQTSSTQTYNMSGTNTSSINASGIGGTFNTTDIQNYVGGNNGNNFIFADGAAITGSINGGSLSSTNILDYSAYLTPISITLSNTNVGTTYNNSSTSITGFSNINNLVANALDNQITLPNKTNSLVISDAGIGSINDPINFSGFLTLQSLSGRDTVSFTTTPSYIGQVGNTATVVINGVTMTLINFNLIPTPTPVPPTPTAPPGGTDIPGVLQPGNTPTTPFNPVTDYTGSQVAQNLTNILNQATADYMNLLNSIRINPYCSTEEPRRKKEA